MSLQATLEQVSAIRHALADPAALIGAGGAPAGGVQAPSEASGASAGESSFAAKLQQASAGYESPSVSGVIGSPASSALEAAGSPSVSGVIGSPALSPLEATGEDTPGQRIVAIAESQIGQTEQPPGSNESPAIAEYRTAAAGAIPGAPWCAYFASWVARQAGEPIGEGGQGAGAVSEVWSWAQSSGRAIPNGPGVVPKPGDLIVFGDEHVGIVRDVLPDGQIQTIEGNYENKVAANVRSPTEATGYVEMS